MEWFKVKSGQGDYSVQSFKEIKGIIEAIKNIPNGILIMDSNIAKAYPQFDSLLKHALLINAVETEKTLNGIAHVLDFLRENNCTKDNTIIAIGGGVTQDIVTFASHVYYRGIKWVFVPTTLLAMSDSCIGAKCGINFNNLKNQLGVFHSPSQVLVCTKFIDTLTEDDIMSGYGEILKLMLIGSVKQLDNLKDKVINYGYRNQYLDSFIRQSLEVKKRIIEIDEYEKDLRHILNYGHTFGHSLEYVTDYEVPHGVAVTLGIDVANYVSLYKGIISSADFNMIHHFIKWYFSYQIAHKISTRDLVNGTKRDKKVRDGKLNMVLLHKIGDLKIVPIEFDSLDDIIHEYMREYNVVYWD